MMFELKFAGLDDTFNPANLSQFLVLLLFYSL